MAKNKMVGPKISHAKRYVQIARRIDDVIQHHHDDVEENMSRYQPMGVYREFQFLVEAVRQLTGSDPAKLNALRFSHYDAEKEEAEDFAEA